MYMHICSDIYMSIIAHVKKSWPFGCNNVLLKKKEEAAKNNYFANQCRVAPKQS